MASERPNAGAESVNEAADLARVCLCPIILLYYTDQWIGFPGVGGRRAAGDCIGKSAEQDGGKNRGIACTGRDK